MTFTANNRIGEIVAAFPGASNLFKAHGIDFCCGGNRPVAAALREKKIDEQAFMAELTEALAQEERRTDKTETDWRSASYSALIERIVTIHHAFLKREMPVIAQFTNKIAHVHAHHAELAVLDRQYGTLKAELDSHLVDEETKLFPLVLAYEASGSQEDLDKAIACLEQLESEHVAAGNILTAMRETTNDYELPADACRTYTLTFYKLEELESDLFQHIHLENNILFERLRAAAGHCGC